MASLMKHPAGRCPVDTSRAGQERTFPPVFHRRWLLGAAGLLLAVFLLAACAPAAPLDPLGGAANPEEYIQRNYAPPSYTNLIVYSKQAYQHGLLYMLGFEMHVNGKSSQMLGYQLFVRNPGGTGWKRTSGAAYSHNPGDRDSPFVDEYIGIGGTNGEMDPVMLYGKVLDPRVKQVNAVYKEGVHPAPIQNGVFAEPVPDGSNLCGLWILGENALVLDRINIARKYENQKQPGIAKPAECAVIEAAPEGPSNTPTPATSQTATATATAAATATASPSAQSIIERQPSHLPAVLPAELTIDIYRMIQRPIAEDRTYPQVLEALQGQSRFSRLPQGDAFWTTLTMAAVAENNLALAPFGYHLEQETGSRSVDLYRGKDRVLGLVSMFGKVSVNQSATDFMMLAYTGDAQNPFVVVHAGAIEPWSRVNGSILNSQPQYLGDAVLYTEKAAGQVTVFRGEKAVHQASAPDQPAASGYIGFWTYGTRWVLEAVDNLTINGLPVNNHFGYTKTYEFHLLNQKPLFFYEKDGQMGLNYNGREIPLPWQSIDHYGCCSGASLNPVQVGNLLMFFAQQDEHWDYVELNVAR